MNGWFTSTRMSRSILVRTLSRTEGTQQKQQHSNQCMNNTDPAKRLCCLKGSLLSSFDLFLNVPVSHRTPFRQWNSGLFLACPNFLLCFIIFPAHSHTAFKKKSPVHIPNFWIISLCWILNIFQITFSPLTVTQWTRTRSSVSWKPKHWIKLFWLLEQGNDLILTTEEFCHNKRQKENCLWN